MLVTTLVGCTVLALALLAEPAAQWWQRAPEAVSQALNRVDRWRASIPGFGPERRTGSRAAAQAPDPLREKITSESVALTATVVGQGLRFCGVRSRHHGAAVLPAGVGALGAVPLH